MSSGRPSHERLKPASIHLGDEAKAYGPRMPWKWIGLGAVVLAFLVGMYHLDEARKEREARETIEATFQGPLATAVDRYRAFRGKIEGWALEAANENPPETHADPRLQISALHQATGAYLRLHADDATDGESIAKAARAMRPDAIGKCLGIAPTSLQGFYAQGDFLLPEWLNTARETENTLRLKVLRDDLELRVKRDLPNLLEVMRAQYFLLTIQRGESRAKGPVDVFLWDLQKDERLLAVRTQSTGTLMRVRIGGSRRANHANVDSAAIHDCSIASQIKEAAGEPAMEIASSTNTGTSAEDASTNGDAGVTR
ncbi:MAG: hypothetical protein KC416_09830 [Myxococcales bacterium]|nr:hypothetical protein [Myxococcales bacterium]